MELYYAPPSIFGRKVLAVLDEKNLDYEIKKMSFQGQDHKKEDYLKLNPNGEIPTLVDDDEVIYESTAIIEYLNDEYPEPPLMPEASAERALIRMIEDYCDLHFYPAIIQCFIKKVLKGEELAEEDIQKVAERMKRIEAYLGDKQYVGGEFSLADCAVMAGIAPLEPLGIFDQTITSEQLKTYIQRLKTRPGWKGASLFQFEEEPQQA